METCTHSQDMSGLLWLLSVFVSFCFLCCVVLIQQIGEVKFHGHSDPLRTQPLLHQWINSVQCVVHFEEATLPEKSTRSVGSHYTYSCHSLYEVYEKTSADNNTACSCSLGNVGVG